ncbi:MAG: TonB-dependent receptor [Salinivirgaceae bacterium]
MRNFQMSITSNQAVVFKRWSHKPYAVFRSMHKVINIGVLSSALTLLAAPNKGYAQTDTITINDHQEIDEVIVSASRTPKVFSELNRIVTVIPHNEILSAPVETLQDLLKYTASADVRQRGAQGVQADISIRGGSNEQTLILLNGIPINDPQTGHHNLNIPIDLSAIERIEILHGSGSRIYGPNAFSGAINLITDTKEARKILVSLNAGQYGLYQGTIAANYAIGKVTNYLSASTISSNGFSNNTDFKTYNLFYHAGLNSNIGQFDLQAGYLTKAFGANSFYTAKYPDQFEQTRTQFASLNYTTQKLLMKINFSIYWRRNHDRFETFREDYYVYHNGYYIKEPNDTAKYSPTYYYPGHNYHLTDVAGTNLSTAFESKFGSTALGVDFKYEHIYSNVLGTLSDTIEAPGEARGTMNKEASRQYLNLYAEQSIQLSFFDISAGALFHYNSDYNWFITGGGELGLKINKNHRAFLSINQAMRMPTFTDLYYDGPTNKGNPNLKPETAVSYELGYKGNLQVIQWDAAVFLRDTKNAIDWVKNASDTEYTTSNYTNMLTKGVELSTRLNAQRMGNIGRFINYLNLSYSYLHVSKSIPDTIDSYYALDYLKQKFALSADHTLYKSLGLAWTLTFQDRNGTYNNVNNQPIGYNPYHLFDVKVYWKKPNYEIYAEGQNLFNITYSDLGGITQPGVWIKGGIKIYFNL